MMTRLKKWWKAEAVVIPREPVVPPPVTMDLVDAAPLPSQEIAAETAAVQIDLLQALVKMGRRSSELRTAMARNAMSHR